MLYGVGGAALLGILTGLCVPQLGKGLFMGRPSLSSHLLPGPPPCITAQATPLGLTLFCRCSLGTDGVQLGLLLWRPLQTQALSESHSWPPLTCFWSQTAGPGPWAAVAGSALGRRWGAGALISWLQMRPWVPSGGIPGPLGHRGCWLLPRVLGMWGLGAQGCPPWPEAVADPCTPGMPYSLTPVPGR